MKGIKRVISVRSRGGQLFRVAGRIEFVLGRRGPKVYLVKIKKPFSISSKSHSGTFCIVGK